MSWRVILPTLILVFVQGGAAASLQPADLLPQEAGMYKIKNNASAATKASVAGAKQRHLKDLYARRMFHGGPPQIPHPVDQDFKVASLTNDCLSCHLQGGFVTSLNAYAPVTPHPDFLNCRQCHVPIQNNNLFRPTQWTSLPPPPLKQRNIPGGPLRIPHELQMRENCLSCHGGPAAASEILTSHPERINCRQCHMLQNETQEFMSAYQLPETAANSESHSPVNQRGGQ